jgi:hypothetical protein
MVTYVKSAQLPLNSQHLNPLGYHVCKEYEQMVHKNERELFHFLLFFFLWHYHYLRLHIVKSYYDWWTTNWEKYGRKHSWPEQDTIVIFTWRDWGKPWKPRSRQYPGQGSNPAPLAQKPRALLLQHSAWQTCYSPQSYCNKAQEICGFSYHMITSYLPSSDWKRWVQTVSQENWSHSHHQFR